MRCGELHSDAVRVGEMNVARVNEQLTKLLFDHDQLKKENTKTGVCVCVCVCVGWVGVRVSVWVCDRVLCSDSHAST